MRIGLNRLHQRADLPRRLTRTLGKALYLLGYYGKAAPGLAGRSGLYRCVQRQYIGLFGDVSDQLGDVADFK